jgi:hypothetical protein
MPGGNSKWYTTLVNEMPSAVNTRQNPIKRRLPDGPTTTPVPVLKKRRGIATRHSNPQNVDDSTRYIKNFESTETKKNVVDLTRSNKNGQFEAQNKVLVAANIKPSSAATAIANQSWWKSLKAHVLFCDVKRSAGDNGNLLSPRK